MKKTILLSTLAASLLCAQEVTFESIEVQGSTDGITLDNISGEQIKSADVAEALMREVPSVSIVRRSGIANDIILRGQKKDNINILIDDAKIYGACPNRMDPPTSHVLNNNIASIEVTEGPFDVENFGTLSGAVKVTTKKPEKGFHGDINLNAGSFGYLKGSATLSGGNDTVKALLTVSQEASGQYLDGNGDDFAAQILKYNDNNTSATSNYASKYSDMDAYKKSTYMGKLFFDITENQTLDLSYTANRSENVLYPSSKMDAAKDDSDLINAKYAIKNLGSWSKELSLHYYLTTVDHPMVTKYRVEGATAYMESALTTRMEAIKLKNTLEAVGATWDVGAELSIRNWDGKYAKYNADDTLFATQPMQKTSINNANTQNGGIFTKMDKKIGKTDLAAGVRFDQTAVTVDGTQQDREYSAVTGSMFATYNRSESAKYFIGLGRSARVPDARELYFVSANTKVAGTDTLNQTFNHELDMGVRYEWEKSSFKTKLFYSMLTDYIYYNKTNTTKNFENVDATIYGAQLSGTYDMTQRMVLAYGLAYQRGQKANALTGQTGTNLAEIPPLKLNASVDYEIQAKSFIKAEVIAADAWSEFDAENGEQAIDAYAVLNLKYNKPFKNGFEFVIGVDNLLNSVYNTTNTYADLTLLSGGDEIMLINEPGRYFYTNLRYQF